MMTLSSFLECSMLQDLLNEPTLVSYLFQILLPTMLLELL
jgi:hypothetical protein